MGVIVNGSGPITADVMICGEAPSYREAMRGRPFVGPSGRDLKMYLSHCSPSNAHYHPSNCYVTNVRKEFFADNHDPTIDELDRWLPVLYDEISRVRPKLFIAVGRYAAWSVLGGWHEWGMRKIHGRPCLPGEFDEVDLAYTDFVVVPCYHSAAGLPDKDPKGAMKGVIYRDFQVALGTYEKLMQGEVIAPPWDEWAGGTLYLDATGEEVADYLFQLSGQSLKVLAVDTEDGENGEPWSIQISHTPGTGLTLRTAQPDFQVGLRAIQKCLNAGWKLVMHFGMHDFPVVRAMGLDLTYTLTHNLYIDTNILAYLHHEPQGLKILAWRHCGMHGTSFKELVSDVGVEKQVAYLEQVAKLNLPRPPKKRITFNDATTKDYSPMSLSVTANRIIADVKNKKVNKDGEPVNPYARWTADSGDASEKCAYKREMRLAAEKQLGPMPTPGIHDVFKVDREWAIEYASRDPDMTFRVYNALGNLIND